MKAKKIAGGLAAALPIVMLSSFANAADQDTMDLVAGHIYTHANALICNTYTIYDENKNPIGEKIIWKAPPSYDYSTAFNAPIWQYKGQVGEMGCVVHASLAKQLYTPFDSSEPPVSKKGKGVAQASSKGASNDLLDGKIDSAVKHICTFIDVIENNARVNTVDFTRTEAEALAWQQVKAAEVWLVDLGYLYSDCAEILGTTY